MNPSTALAQVFVDEMWRNGVREAVLAPGSRSAPLAFALHASDAQGRIRLHVRIDERAAGFLALGLAKASRRPVPVVCTSGTAAANLHPAVLEAHHAGVPLVVLTADRPPELRGVGANQTTDQLKLYGTAVRMFHEVGAPERRAGQNAYWRELIGRALAIARGFRDRDPGPVHLNVAFREPLVPDVGDTGEDWPESLEGRPNGARWTRIERATTDRISWLDPGPRTIVVAGDGADVQARWLAETAGWPLLAEPSSGARSGPNALGPYRLILASDSDLVRQVERVVVYGWPTLSRPVTQLLSRDDVEVVVVSRRPAWSDPGHRAYRVSGAVALEGTVDGAGRREPDEWLSAWLEADQRARAAVRKVLAEEPELTGPLVAREVAAAVPGGGLLVAGSSNAIRDLDLAADPWTNRLVDESGRIDPRDHRRVLANRGLAGIDGTLSTAIGAALVHRTGPAFALVGDLAFLHDSNALVRGAYEARPDLTIVVVNDDGGGIFTTLEQGAPAYEDVFDRLFGTPHGVDIGTLAAATRTPYTLVRTRQELRAALSRSRGLRVVEVRTDRSRLRELHERLRAAVADAVVG
ncbi:2-succinyl-5-enolpyruvyl-6-hydroxy-3-cyclohexene-1-carboxylic-acid synthase [Thermasporomyces composti]|jgi:2-succinyl-5-enolpyruvyl-6-hydroxy-3-cyclohexene-1-carboxylate synthase|uniref:2-succinyl-5-enolpyruvyl-6-hydroxy-3-cyclohexene-1-carboxylate synthase n=1 Tax=Thermasporomyces composti TaxID=696763 RepID=A0A3D9V6G4_THECX|nr:2-succinyl-5-enolpyruvyl-6-hydroxy-3-cyclohexene-1-carboxylic-acid synthase [Thermasporomyces composti]REF37107.1 2-succinyl-5-enolpyruvyl-6-hydroxy-3-cyclohexene-1-carboxylate synthase [Thermasporomyces composti]